MQTPWTNTVKTLEQARDFVLEVGICGILYDAKATPPTLWDAVEFPDKQPGEGGWGEKMGKVWTWKNGTLLADYQRVYRIRKKKLNESVLIHAGPRNRSLFRGPAWILY